MTPQQTNWRLCLREVGDDGQPGGVLGTGFAVMDHAALTCAHVVEDVTECWVEPLDDSVKTQRCRIQVKPHVIDRTDGSSDVAVIGLPNPVTPAPLGPYEPPASGTEIEVVGYVERYLDWGRTQRRIAPIGVRIQNGKSPIACTEACGCKRTYPTATPVRGRSSR